MLKNEINEIKRLYGIKNCSITRIAGCYVDGNKEVLSRFANNFLSMPEEIMHKYLAIFKKALSGTVEKNLLSLQFPTQAEEVGGTQNELLKLRDSQLKNDEMLRGFYEKIIDTYEYVGNYLILLIHNVYDIPGKTSDNNGMEDASDEVYSYITCVICPVSLTKPGLSYDKAEDNFKNRELDWVVGMPDVSFMFPAFNDRSEDIHEVLYYEKKPKLEHKEIIESILGCSHKMSAVEQKEAFNTMLEECGCTTSEVKNIHEKLNEMIEKEDSPQKLIISKTEMEAVVRECASEEVQEIFSHAFDDNMTDKEVIVENVTNTKSIEIKNDCISIKCRPDQAQLVTEKVIDGIRCLVIEMGSGVEVNGVRVI